MTIGLAVSSTTATTAALTATGLPGSGTVEVQVASRPDFAWCVCPVITGLALASPINLTGLNQDATYYVRARGRSTGGVAEAWSNTVALRTPLSAARTTTPAAVMIEPAIVVVPQPVVAWAADNQQAGYPVDNLGYDAPVGWHSVGATHAFEMAIAPEPVDTIAMLMSNVSEAATVTIRAGANQANVQGGSPTYQLTAQPFRASANMPGRPGFHSLIRLPSAQSYPYWRIVISGASLTGNLMHLEHAIIGKSRQSKNFSVDKTETLIDLGRLERTRSGIPDRNSGYRMRRADFDIAMLTEQQFELQYYDLLARVGATDPVLVVPNSKPGAFLHDRILYGAITSSKVVNVASPYFTRSFTIESLV